MNINTTMGIKSIKYGDVGASSLTAVGDVYQETCTFVEKDKTGKTIAPGRYENGKKITD